MGWGSAGWLSDDGGWYKNAAGGDAAQTTAFLARVASAGTTLDGTHTNAYKALINGLVSDGVFAKLDILFIFATQDTTTAQLNLTSATFSSSLTASPTFTADRGYTGNGTSAVVGTTFNPSTATSPQFAQNSAHISAWNLSNISDGGVIMGLSPSAGEAIYPQFSAGSTYIRVNDSAGPQTSPGDVRGHWVGNRDGANSREAYFNGSSFGTYGSIASGAVPNGNICALGGSTSIDSTQSNNQCAMISAGGSLSSTDASNFYSRLRTYMTAVGVP